ncbi:unnamed protein product [Symbiodinium natans]|uniref:Sulfotransferase n=1 Tax=Symbiodinium natans TaxID=878477 RepID=A0A812S1C3_9DINO|nr:unnamed protein product [Symbiodinium natans]
MPDDANSAGAGIATPAPAAVTLNPPPPASVPAVPTLAPAPVLAPAPPATVSAADAPLKSCLAFVHIPKAAGSNVEGVIARAFGYNQVVENPGDCISMRKIEKTVRFWGMCDDRLQCESKKLCGWSGADCCYVNKSFVPQPTPNKGVDRCSFWHFPPAYDAQLAKTYSEDCDSFCVVREPLSRFLSHWRWRHFSKPADCSPEVLEKYTKEKLAQAREDVLLEDCHFTPQVYYAFQNGDPKAPRICRHIIKLEHLDAEFAPLMAQYNLEKVHLGKGKSRSSKKCDIVPTEATLQLVKEFYAEDYKAFGY